MEDTRRNQLIEFIEKEFIGPDPIDLDGFKQENGEEILISDPPITRYIAGILYPRDFLENNDVESVDNIDLDNDYQVENENCDEGEFSKNIKINTFNEEAEELIDRSNAYRPSAISLTVAIKDTDRINIEVSAGIYKKVKEPGKTSFVYPRTPILWDNNKTPIDLPKIGEIKKNPINNTGLVLDITYRYKKNNYAIYTFSLENTKEKTSTCVKDEDCFFQTKFKLYSDLGFEHLTDSEKITQDEDYASNQMMYRDIHNYAIGHGCSADWEDKEIVSWISTATFPKYDIKPIVPNILPGISLDMFKLSSVDYFEENISELNLLCNQYSNWIDKLKEIKESLKVIYKETAERHIKNCEKCLSRMKEGIALLQKEDSVRTAFQYMNCAMLMQQLHYNMPLQTWIDNGNDDIELEKPAVEMPDINNPDTWHDDKKKYGHWRPFQLVFILINLKSMFIKDCEDRSLVDLIWFPTGGGKTEAYLGLSAYTIFLRRLRNKDDSGTAILMRYTLRLLTAQQYERAASLICACEYIRSKHVILFGKNRISIGLWVGQSTTPNKNAEAVKQYEKLYKSGNENNFVMLKCPWCGAQMGPIKVGTHYALPGYSKEGKRKEIVFRCKNKLCDFSNDTLPLYIIDEIIYERTPTLLIGTVDKFAMLPFLPEAQSIFGYHEGKKITSPDLIIQDELHLISGPLGSMVGHYETLINELCRIQMEDKVIYPKIIASTATISRAKEQCHALYGCDRNKVFQFPPSGLDAGDSFFAKEDKTQNGRRYVGILASGMSSDATTSIRLYASLLYGAKALSVENEKDRDPYWTNMGYYNSLRELGQAATWIHADIEQHLDVMYKRRRQDKQFASREEYQKSRRYIYNSEELTSRISGSDVTESLAKLNESYPMQDNGKSKKFPIDICLATNMISVGLDISRLGLMTVTGQPKTTSEYIQATSRVGRNSKDAPGLVFVVYRPGRPRDKSYYEHFKSYHSKIYCNVEPTSVTPFSEPVRERALHAIIIAMLRLEHSDCYGGNPPKLPTEEIYKHIVAVLKERVSKIDEEELEDTLTEVKDIFREWRNWNPKIWNVWNPDEEVPLMHPYGTHRNKEWRHQSFETPTSMRSVDESCEAELLSTDYTSEDE